MQIRKGAWHYRLFRLGNGGCPPARTNLCSYFWGVVFGLGTAIFLACLGGIGIYGAGYALCFHTLSTVKVVATAAALLGALLWWDEHKYDKREPGLVVSYLAARKAKMCPLVTFTKEDT